MGWVRKASPYLLVLVVVICSIPNAVGGHSTGSETVETRSLTTLQESSNFIEFDELVTLDGQSIANITGFILHENTTPPSMYFMKRYLLNATITLYKMGPNVDRVYEIKFILQLLDEGENVLNKLERDTFTEIKVLNQTVHTTVFFSISDKDVSKPEDVVAARIVLACKEGRAPLRVDAETETELIQSPLDLVEGPSLVKTSPEFVLDGVQAKDGTLLHISGKITTDETDPLVWYYGTLYTISIEIEVLGWGWDARGEVQRIHDMTIILEFIGEGGVSVHSITIPIDPPEIVVVHAPITHEFSYSVSEQDVKSLEEVSLSLQLQFKEELVDREGKTQRDETHQELTRFRLNFKERSAQREQAFSKTLTLSKGSLVNVEGILELENTTTLLLYFGKRYPLTVNITVVRWGESVDRLHKIKLFLDIIGGGGAVLASLEQDAIPNEIVDLNSPLHTTRFFRVQEENTPTTENVEIAVGISVEEGVKNAPDTSNHETITKFPVQLEERPSNIATDPDFMVDVEGMAGTILRVTGNVTVDKDPEPSWYYTQKYTVRTKLEVLEWGWDARGSVSRIYQIRIILEFIGQGGVPVHSTDTSTTPSEIVALNAPITHEFDVSVSKQNVNSLTEATISFKVSFIEEILDLNIKTTTQEATRFPIEFKEKPGEEVDLMRWVMYGGVVGLIVVIGILGRKLLMKREEDYWLK